MARRSTENRKELKELKVKAQRILLLSEKYPDMDLDRRMSLTVKLNEIMERVEFLKRNRNNSSAYEFTYVLKKKNVKNRKL